MRDPVMYRIRHMHHQRTGDRWCIYPMYDWAHGQCDSIEGITHSLCTLEFEHHRPLYDWFCDSLGIYKPQQIEFARLNVEYMLTSKRKLLQLVEGGHVDGWDDPRMPTLRGLRRRGMPPEALVAFCKHVGVAKFNSTHEIGLLEFFVRDHLNKHALRRMAVLDPLELVIENWPAGPGRAGRCPEQPRRPGGRHAPGAVLGRTVDRARRLHGEPAEGLLPAGPRPRGAPALGLLRHLHRRRQGRQRQHHRGALHLRSGDPGGNAPDGRKVKATIHWVSARTPSTPRCGSSSTCSRPRPGQRRRRRLPEAAQPEQPAGRARQARTEPREAKGGERFQFERIGYFYCDHQDSQPGAPVFHRTVGLKDSYQKAQQKGGAKK
jgi:glutaminyl-tRNA synthetase